MNIDAQHMRPLPNTCSPLAVNKTIGFCLCVNRREAEWWKGRVDSDALLNTDERKASWILIRLRSFSSSLPRLPSASENTSEKCFFMYQRGKSLGQPFKVMVQVFSKEQLFLCVFIKCRINKRLDFDNSLIEQYFRFKMFWSWTEIPVLCLTNLEAKCYSIFSSAHSPARAYEFLKYSQWGFTDFKDPRLIKASQRSNHYLHCKFA